MGWRLLVTVIVTALFAALPAPALADPTASEITTPSDPSHFVLDGENPATVVVSGTTTGGSGNDPVDIRCYLGSGSALVASNIPVFAGSFSANVSLLGLASETCVLRAVPNLTIPAAPPGGSTPFSGPRIGVGYYGPQRINGGPNDRAVFTYELDYAQLEGMMFWGDIGAAGGLVSSYLFDPTTLEQTGNLFAGAGYLDFTDETGTRSGLLVDANSAYAGASAGSAWSVDMSHNAKFSPGFPALGPTWSIGAGGALTITDPVPIGVCSPSAAVYPATQSSCSSWAPSGVRVDRTVVQDRKGRRATVTDVWRSTDGQSHAIDALYDNRQWQAPGPGGLQFPWADPGFSYASGTDIAPPPSGPASIYIRENLAAADGDPSHPRGTITMGSAPNAIRVRTGTTGAPSSRVVLRYQRQVPPCGSLTLRFAYANTAFQSDLEAMATESRSMLGSPEISTSGCPGPGDTTTPPGDTPGPGPGSPPPPAPIARDTTAPQLSLAVARRLKLATVLRKGIGARARCNERCVVNLSVVLGRRTLARAKATLQAGRTKRIALKLTRSGKKALAKRRLARLTVRMKGADPAGNTRSTSRKVSVFRPSRAR